MVIDAVIYVISTGILSVQEFCSAELLLRYYNPNRIGWQSGRDTERAVALLSCDLKQGQELSSKKEASRTIT